MSRPPICLVLLCALVAGTARADDAAKAGDATPPQPCRMIEDTSVDMLTQPDGAFAISAILNGRNYELLVDTGSVNSSVNDETAFELGLSKKWTPNGGAFMNDIRIDQYSTLDSLQVGLLKAEKWTVIIIPNNLLGPTYAGLLGPDFLANWDVEFDFYRGKLDLFEHNVCQKFAVYWSKDPFAALPIDLDQSQYHIDVHAMLDGKPVSVTFDTGSDNSIMSLDAAADLFGWATSDPRLKLVGSQNINGGKSAPLYSFPFATLDFQGIVIKNPRITLIPMKNFFDLPHGDASIVLGMSVLRQLHMYVDYQGRTLYLTAAEAH